jgi:proteasome lid subunit RPN8/RPN11
VTVQKRALTEIIAHAREALPAECCGLLLGTGDAIHEAVRIRNLAGPGRYLLDPKEHIDARRVARHRGLDVLGFYHSHPFSAPEPSSTDVAEASYPDHVYLIVGVQQEPAQGGADARLFRLEAHGFVSVPFVVVDGNGNTAV